MEENKIIFVKKKYNTKVYMIGRNGFGVKSCRSIGHIYYEEMLDKYLYRQSGFAHLGDETIKQIYDKLKELNK